MPGPYIKDSHYVYGKPLQQPYPAYYNSSWYHRKPPRRYLSDMLWFLDDGSAYTIDNRPSDPNERVNRSLKNINVLNIETVAMHSLRIKLYGPTEEEDIDLILEIGKMYDIMYVTEGGLKIAHGVLKLIDSTIPDTCTRYIGEFNSTVNTAWIALDCSTVGKSDKRKIYIASIRFIQEVEDPEYNELSVELEDMSDSQKLNEILEQLPILNTKLDKILLNLFKHDSDIKFKLDKMNPAEKLNFIISYLSGEEFTDKIEVNTDHREPSIDDESNNSEDQETNNPQILDLSNKYKSGIPLP